MEAGTGGVHRHHTSEFSTVKCGWGEAGTAAASGRKETCPAPARGVQTCGPEDTWETACPNCVKTSACAERTAPRWNQSSR